MNFSLAAHWHRFAPAQDEPAARNAAPTPAQPARRANTVAEWKSQVTWFALVMTLLVVLVALGSAGAMWHVLERTAEGEREGESRSRAAIAARLAVLDVDRMLLQMIATGDAARARSWAVASISAASRLEDAITALLQALPGNAEVLEMSALVEQVKAPRVQVIVLARRGDRALALDALQGIAEPMKKIDALSAAILDEQGDRRQRTATDRLDLFRMLLFVLVGFSAASVLLGFAFYRRLMRSFARTDQVERLLEEVAHSAGALASDGKDLDGLNSQVQQANENLRRLLQRLESSALAMTQEAKHSLDDLQHLNETCQSSSGTSRRHAEEAAVVAQQIQSSTRQMHQVQATTDALEQSRAEIAGFADQIESISSVTRLLSLNAAVEAARAGGSGRGFAVIASSVRELSEATQKAAVQIRRASQDITRQLAATGSAIKQTSALMDDCAGRVGALDSSARSNQALVAGMATDVDGFRGSFLRQVERIEAMDQETRTLAEALHQGRGHAEMLDATSRALARTSGALQERLSSLQN
ncbi:MAG: methyl-accepting chemotaxis protein [Burkholderiales bacterium]|nr:methyl-accepting chemotaxis protein [Burkholderiales bacterium]